MRKSSEDKTERKNPFEGVTAEKYARILAAFLKLPSPTIDELATAAEVGKAMVKRALKEGWPKLGLPPLSDAAKNMIDPVHVHAIMNGMHEEKKQIIQNLFGSLPGALANVNTPTPLTAKEEAAQRAAETGVAARIAMSGAVNAARSIEALSALFLKKIQDGEIEIPDQIRPEHLFLLARAADTAAGAIHKAVQTERLRNGQPDAIVGQHIVALIADATPEELKIIAITGQLPPRLMGGPAPVKNHALPPVIDIVATEVKK